MMDLEEIDKFCQKINFGSFEARILNYPFKRCFLFPKVIVLNVQNVLEYSKELIQRNPHIESYLSFDNTFVVFHNTNGNILVVVPTVLSLDECVYLLKNLSKFEKLNSFLRKYDKRFKMKVRYLLQGRVVFDINGRAVKIDKINFKKVNLFFNYCQNYKNKDKITNFLIWGK